MIRLSLVLAVLLIAVGASAQETLVFEPEDWSEPKGAWGKDITPEDKWNLWSKDQDADKKWSGGMVLQSPPVMEDRETPEDGAPVLHTVITGIPRGRWLVQIKHGRALAASLDGEKWTDLSKVGGRLGTFDIEDGKLEFWVDDRFASKGSPGFSYYDCITLTPAMPEEMGVANGGFEAGKEMPGSGWSWFSRQGGGATEFSEQAHDGQRSVLIRHDDERDWAFSNSGRLDVEPRQMWVASAWVKCQDTDGIELAIVALHEGQMMKWNIGSDGVFGTKDWTRIEAGALIPPGCDQIYARFVGTGKCHAWLDDVALRQGEPKPKGPPKPKVAGWATERVTERMGRGMLAMPIEGGQVYVGWRLLKGDPEGIAFNVYRASGGNEPVKLNDEPLTKTTDFMDEAAPEAENSYYVCAVVDGKELEPSERALLPANAEVRPYLSFKLDGEHTFQKVGLADLNGDGRYDYVIKQPRDNIDPYRLYWKASPDTYKIEAYLHDGTFLWRNDLGWAIERGIWYSPYVVYDLDGDGKAEVAVKTGEGDPREEDGRVREGPEHISIWDGMTGKEKARADWPSRDGFVGSSGYNLGSRNQLGIAYLDGKTPCLLVARGTYTTMKLDAYQYHDGKLEKLWSWDNREEQGYWRGQGAHFMHAADVDDDGRDEVILGSCVVDDNGQGLWSTGLGHPDKCYVTDVDPSRPGLEIFYVIEPAQIQSGICLADARTGEVIWGLPQQTWHVGSGMTSDIDPLHPGCECWAAEDPKSGKYTGPAPRWLFSATGEVLARNADVPPFVAVYWDADPQRELLRGKRIYDYLGDTHTEQIEGGQVAWADILGDWREEIVTSVAGELRVYTTTIPAEDRRACLMQDPIYRLDVAHLAMGYAQPPMTSFCIGGQRAAMGLRLPPGPIKVGETAECKVLVAAPGGRALAGEVRLRVSDNAAVEPALASIEAVAGGIGEATFELSIRDRPSVLGGAQTVTIEATFSGSDTVLRGSASARIADEPLTDVPMVQAEDFAAQSGGEVQLRDDKVGAVEGCFSHWDDEGHELTWKINAPQDGEYLLAVRYCSIADVRREVAVDGAEPMAQTFAATGGFAATANDWAHIAVCGADGEPMAFTLCAGEHEVRMTNADGQGMNVDYLALVRAE